MEHDSEHPWKESLRRLAVASGELCETADRMGLAAPEREDWYGALTRHLLPQIDRPAPLVVAITGGTNTGKSAIFNHLAGAAISRVHHEATKTKHPVCLVADAEAAAQLPSLFPEFVVRPWKTEDDPLDSGTEDLLFYRAGARAPEDLPGVATSNGFPSSRSFRLRGTPVCKTGSPLSPLVLVDTPDIDGARKDNWRRADRVRHAADVVVCVITGQKHADDAVVRFFREAARGDKTFLVVVNMVEWPEDRSLCEAWLGAFQDATGVTADLAYAVSRDRVASIENRLPIHPLSPAATDIRDDLSTLHFDAIRFRSLGGSLRQVLDRQRGLPRLLDEIAHRSGEFAEAAAVLSETVRASGITLPRMPAWVVWEPIRRWLQPRRTRLDRWIHGGYGWIVAKATLPFRKSEHAIETTYRKAEWETLQGAVLVMFDQLDRLRRSGSDMVRRAVTEMLGAVQREAMFRRLRERLDELPLMTEDYRNAVADELERFAVENPRMVRLVTWSLVTTAVLRPALSIGLIALAPGADLLAHAATDASLAVVRESTAQGAVAVGTHVGLGVGQNVAAEIGGHMAVTQLLARLFQKAYAARAATLRQTLEAHLDGPLLAQMRELATAGDSPALQTARREIERLRTLRYEMEEMWRSSSIAVDPKSP